MHRGMTVAARCHRCAGKPLLVPPGEPDLALAADAALDASAPPLTRPCKVCATLLSQRQLVRADSPFHLRIRVAAMPLLRTKRLPLPLQKKRRIEGVLAEYGGVPIVLSTGLVPRLIGRRESSAGSPPRRGASDSGFSGGSLGRVGHPVPHDRVITFSLFLATALSALPWGHAPVPALPVEGAEPVVAPDQWSCMRTRQSSASCSPGGAA